MSTRVGRVMPRSVVRVVAHAKGATFDRNTTKHFTSLFREVQAKRKTKEK